MFSCAYSVCGVQRSVWLPGINFLWHDPNLNPIKLNIFLLVLVSAVVSVSELSSEHCNSKCLTLRLRHGILVSTHEMLGLHSSDSPHFVARSSVQKCSETRNHILLLW